MNEYVGKKCPYCKTEFTENDDIVVCSSCDMPHHKDCWIENQGCTTFGCTGTIAGQNGGVNSVTATSMDFSAAADSVFCTSCGARCSAGAQFCVSCGARIAAPQPQYTQPVQQYAQPAQQYTQPVQQYAQPVQQYAQPAHQYTQPVQQYAQPAQQYTQPAQQYTQPVQQYTQPAQQYTQPAQQYAQPQYQQNMYQQGVAVDPLLISMTQENQQYYSEQFSKLKSNNSKVSWNWPAFLVTPFWFIYRRMYAYGFSIMGVALVLSLFNSGFLTLLILAGYVVCSLFANYLYMSFLEKKIAENSMYPEPLKTQNLAKFAGPDKNMTIGAVVGYVVLAIILGLILVM